ncbi:MAG TPA: M28 family peptidase [Vicinamibacteria bacterium]|nr:M28 family peptidase [Vicinamibacteria bacterium]
MKAFIRRFLPAALLALPAVAIVAEDETKIPGFFRSSTGKELEAESFVQRIPTSDRFAAHLAYLTEEPHPTGSARNMELADYVRDRFLEYGLENVQFHDTPALLSYGRSASVRLLQPVEVELELAEKGYPEDKDSYLYGDPGVVPYHEYAASGDVSAEVVYANSGSPEDFEKLAEMGVEVRDRIVVMRYSAPYSYRGYKVYLAETHGAAGAIIYSDPEDDGYAKGETYPHGPWGPPSHIQWGSIVYDWFGFGVVPFTFHWKPEPDGTWVEGPVRDRQLPKIPSIPMSHEDAAEILSRLRGPVVPPEWQGGLPFTYHVGPGPVRLRLTVENVESIGTMRNVIGMFPGADEPSQWVVVGNHRDAWNYGAVDPSSGTAVLLEVARALGEAVRRGYRPRRTIVFANWDGEEDLLGGSTSWAKEHRDQLRREAVAYVNLDSGAHGSDFAGGATPALADFLRDVTKFVDHPNGSGSVYDAWASRSSGVPEVETIVGATDYTAFQENIGVSCIDLASKGPYGVYHSQYDNTFWLSRIGDPGFRFNTTLARILGVVVLRLANANVLPMRYSAYAATVLEHIAEIERKAAGEREIDLDRARASAERWGAAAAALEKRLDERINGDGFSDQDARSLNLLLMQVERAMTEEEGLASRPFFKHLIYAPQPTYRKEVLPRLFEAIEAGKWEDIERLEAQLVVAFDGAADLLRRAAALGE